MRHKQSSKCRRIIRNWKQVCQFSALAYIPTRRWFGQCVTPGSTAVQCIIVFHFLALGLTPRPKVHQTWRRPAAGASPLSCKNLAYRASGLRDVHYKNFSLCGLEDCLPKGEMTCYPLRSRILPNFIVLCQPMPEISLTKILQTKKVTNSKWYIPSMWAYRHVGMIRKCVGGIKWQRIDNCQLLEHYVVYVLARRGEFIRLEFSSMVTECCYDYVFVCLFVC